MVRSNLYRSFTGAAAIQIAKIYISRGCSVCSHSKQLHQLHFSSLKNLNKIITSKHSAISCNHCKTALKHSGVHARKMASVTPETRTINGKEYYTITEGKAEILFPSSNEVFYNPVQEFNRDLTVAAIGLHAEEYLSKSNIKVSYPGEKDGQSKTMDKSETTTKDTNTKSQEETANQAVKSKSPDQSSANGKSAKTEETKTVIVQPGEHCESGISILEGLSASGLRSIRFAKEVAGVKEVVANDFASEAVLSIKQNIEHNEAEHLVKPSHADAALLMYQHRAHNSRYDVIDLDPYGSPAQFLDSAVQSVKDGGMLCITCTDMAVLCGNHGETAYTKYGGLALHAKYGHEMALRIVLQSIQAHANRYHRYIEPLLSISVDFYVRFFIRVHTGQATVKKSASKHAMVYSCVNCETFHLQRLGVCIQNDRSIKYRPSVGPPMGQTCEHCGGRFQIGGPMWAEPLHNAEFVSNLLKTVQANPDRFKTSDRIIGLLTVVKEELVDCPLYYTQSRLCSVLHCSCPSLIQFRSAILHAGYQVSSSHASPEAFKTDAPSHVIWDIMRAWVKLNPVKQERLTDGNPATKILSQEPSIEVSFSPLPAANPPSRKFKLVRFPENPQKYWGPKARAKKSGGEPLANKRARLQGKRGQEGQLERDYKNYPCKKFKKGLCELGDDCRYTHDSTAPSEQVGTGDISTT
ncbi:tRNA (guanine(26)-N(2))-dimethyltransferase-like isoform X2 [Ptychodera flava]|uniref:tRNA (guanine(26)-N(2))-dimethyltransferase-like isoform X2 n=1 Tax=Ptychodera flava TaxID=63121 RepID=UPI003969FDD6